MECILKVLDQRAHRGRFTVFADSAASGLAVAGLII